LQVDGSQQFAAAVSNTTYTSVNWLVSGVLGGNSSVGTISSSGLYTAPAGAPSGSVLVTAQSTYDPNSSATASVTITAPVAHDVNLSWAASSSAVAGYNVYRGAQPSGPFAKINPSLETATVYTDGTVVSGQTYYYATTAVDSSGTESGYSNVAQAVVP
jgi:fibronectin type 3 domain-containing protein